jgi:hypothetical protein
MFRCMSTIVEIEAAIKKLPRPQVEELAAWLERHRESTASPPSIENWLARARGVARSGVRTADVMLQTRGEE